MKIFGHDKVWKNYIRRAKIVIEIGNPDIVIFMKGLLKIIILSMLTIHSAIGAEKCPENARYFCITPEMAPDSQIKILDFYQIPAKIISLFNRELQNTAAPLIFDLQWESPYFGAGMKFYDGRYQMMILGGTTRVEDMTVDAYAAIVCHELGHLIGGAPYQTVSAPLWSSEGQADYFAARTCLPRYFKSIGVADSDIKSRVEQSGYEMLSTLAPHSSETRAQLPGLTRFSQIADEVPSTLLYNYPTLQCRYETFMDANERSRCWFIDVN